MWAGAHWRKLWSTNPLERLHKEMLHAHRWGEGKLVLVDGKVVNRDHLSLTVGVDDDIVDGALAVRFVTRLRHLVESAYDIDE